MRTRLDCIDLIQDASDVEREPAEVASWGTIRALYR